MGGVLLPAVPFDLFQRREARLGVLMVAMALSGSQMLWAGSRVAVRCHTEAQGVGRDAALHATQGLKVVHSEHGAAGVQAQVVLQNMNAPLEAWLPLHAVLHATQALEVVRHNNRTVGQPEGVEASYFALQVARCAPELPSIGRSLMEGGMGEEGMMGGEHTQALVQQEFRGVERLVGAFLLHHTHLHLHDNHLKPGTFFLPCQIIPVKNKRWSDRTALTYGHERQSKMNVRVKIKNTDY
jgi:hypothetical protein